MSDWLWIHVWNPIANVWSRLRNIPSDIKLNRYYRLIDKGWSQKDAVDRIYGPDEEASHGE